MSSPLPEYEVNMEVTEREDQVLPIWMLEEICDIVSAISAIYTVASKIDLNAINPRTFDQTCSVPKNDKGNIVITVIVKAYLPDSKDFVGPRFMIENNITNEIEEDVICQLILEYVGEVDAPCTGSLVHHGIITREVQPPNKEKVIVSSTTDGVTSLLRTYSRLDSSNETVANITFLVTRKDKPCSSYWRGYAHTLHQHTLGYSKDAQIYATLALPVSDTKPEKLI